MAEKPNLSALTEEDIKFRFITPAIEQAGWQVLVIWACNLTKEKIDNTMQSVAVALNENLLNTIK